MCSLQNHQLLVYTTFSSHNVSTISLQNHHFSNLSKTHISTQRTTFIKIPTTHRRNVLKSHVSMPFCEIPAARLLDSIQNNLSNLSDSMRLRNSLVITSLMAGVSIPSPSFAVESETISDKVNIESILTSIDDFFNRNPFFVAGVTFIWLVVVPLTKEYLKKFKLTSAINVFGKLRNDPSAQLLDIRNKQSQMYMSSPNLKILKKNVVQVEFLEGGEDKFVKEVLSNFQDPANTIVCVLDNFDGNSMKVAELLINNGFKEAYAIKGGLRGKDGWQEIQEKFLPPSVHVYARKKNKKLAKLEVNGENVKKLNDINGQLQASAIVHVDNNWKENGYMKPTETAAEAKLPSERPLSPYPNYPGLKPPSSPTPSKS